MCSVKTIQVVFEVKIIRKIHKLNIKTYGTSYVSFKIVALKASILPIIETWNHRFPFRTPK